MAIVSYFLIFGTFICSSLKYFIPVLGTYKSFALAVAIMAAIVLLKYVLNTHFGISMGVFITVLIILTVGVTYYVSPWFINDITDAGAGMYKSFRLALYGQTFPCVLMAAVVSSKKQTQNKIKRLSPVVGFIFTIVAFVSSFNPGFETSGGFALTENGLNYQHISYIAAFASALIEYYVLTSDSDVHFSFLRSPYAKYVAFVFITINAVSILIAGGRGGFVEYIVFLLFTLYLSFKRKKLTAVQLFRWIFLIMLIIVAGYFVLKFAANSTISTNGFSRIQGLLNGKGDEGRKGLRAEAFSLFAKRPVFGNGMGSVLLLMGIYSHNIFTDALMETGVAGTVILVIVLVKSVRKGFHMIKLDVSDSFWMYIMLCGLMMSMFSGYWLTQFPLWWGISYYLNFDYRYVER